VKLLLQGETFTTWHKCMNTTFYMLNDTYIYLYLLCCMTDLKFSFRLFIFLVYRAFLFQNILVLYKFVV